MEKTTDTGDGAATLYAGFDARKVFRGVAIPAKGMGYQDTIELLYGYGMQQQAVLGLVILQSRETPGLGGKIADDRHFLDNFNGLSPNVNPQTGRLAMPLELVKNQPKTEPWQVDAITGATVSSQAVVSILNRSLSFWLPLLNQQKERFNFER